MVTTTVPQIRDTIHELFGYGNLPYKQELYTAQFMTGHLPEGHVVIRGIPKEQVDLPRFYDILNDELNRSLQNARGNKEAGVPFRIRVIDVEAIFYDSKKTYRHQHRLRHPYNRSV